MSKLSHAGLTIGIAEVDITPPVGVANRCWGAAAHDVASGVHRELKACVWVIGPPDSTDSTPIVLAGMDGSWWQGGRREFACRAAIARAAETSPERVLLCLSHSHAAVPLVDDVPAGPGSELLESYLDALPNRLAAAAAQAASDRQQGIVQATYGNCPLAACRDQQGDARWIVGHDPDAQADQTLAVARLSHPDGRLRSILVNYACHPTSLAWENALLSPDYIGALREEIQDVFGVPILFLQGAGGDLAPARQYSGEPLVADRNGECLALSVRATLSILPPPGQALRHTGNVTSGADLGCWSPSDVQLDRMMLVESCPTELPWRSDFESAATLLEKLAVASGPEVERLRRRQRLRMEFGDEASLRINAWGARLGEIMFFGAPAENYSQMQIHLREHFSDHVVLVANHCNGGSGYLVPETLHGREHFYPAWQSPVAAGSYETLQSVFKEMGNQML